MVHPAKLFGRLGNQMFQYAFLIAYARDHALDFYFQDPWFFNEHKEAVRVLFSAEIPKKNDCVAVHVRRAANPINPDEPKYSENPYYVDLFKLGYYQRAMAMFPVGTKFMIFSDDPLWCEEQAIFSGCDISWCRDEVEDMNLMASCKAHIIANSSFSWWGAWLCPDYPNNKVIAPKEWFADGVERCILPDHWIRV